MRGLTRREALKIGTAALASLPTLARAGQQPDAATIPTRGFNIPGWVDRADGQRPAPELLEDLHAKGFRAVRLPVEPGLIAAASVKDRAQLLDRIGFAASELVHRGYSVTLDMHPGDRVLDLLRTDPKAAGSVVERAWTQVAMVMLGLPEDTVLGELLNEPPLDRSDWLPLRERLAATIRKVCPRHGIVWGPSKFQGIWELSGTPPLDDPRAIAAVHYYAPISFTHQCANWDASGVADIRGVPFPASAGSPAIEALRRRLSAAGNEKALQLLDEDYANAWTADRIASDFADAARWAKTHRQPVILNEFGVLNFCADSKSRAAWVSAVRRAAETHGLGWTYWEFDQGFGFVKDRTRDGGIDETMVAALIPGSRT